MKAKQVKEICSYYRDIPGMVRLLNAEAREIAAEYDGLNAVAMDGMPHGSTPGRPVEGLAEKAVENNLADKLQVLDVKKQILETDAAAIKDCLDAVNGRYKQVLTLRYRDKYSWGGISARMGIPDSTARNWHIRAIERMGEALDDVPMVDELLGRALRARS